MKEIIAEVASVRADEPAMVAGSILRSVNVPDAETDSKWAQVAQRREEKLRLDFAVEVYDAISRVMDPPSPEPRRRGGLPPCFTPHRIRLHGVFRWVFSVSSLPVAQTDATILCSDAPLMKSR